VLDELRDLLARHAGRPHPALPDLTLATSTAPTRPLGGLGEPVFALVAQGCKRTVLADRRYDYGPGQYLVTSVDLPLTGHILRAAPTAPFLGLSLALRPEPIATLLLDAPAPIARTHAAAPAPGGPGIAVSDAPPDLVDAVVRLLRLLDNPADLPVLAPSVEREILWRLLTGAQGALVAQLGRTDGRTAHIARALRAIRTRYREPLPVADLARLAGMSVTSFHRHFRAVTAMTPLQYQKQVRLLAARARLLVDPTDIAATAHAVGYTSQSHFTRDYHRQFGQPPSRDAARMTV
jgi:AraC-like DNA-binding protein